SPVRKTAVFAFALTIEGPSAIPLSIQGQSNSGTRFTDATRASYGSNFITLAGGIPPYTCALSPGSTLPAGLQVFNFASIETLYTDPSDCYVIGSTLVPGDYSFSIRATDSVGNFADFPTSLHVSQIGLYNPYPPYSPNIPFLNQPYSQPLLPVGGTQSYTIT